MSGHLQKTWATALSHYSGLESATPVPLGSGLINETFVVQNVEGKRFVLQRVNPIFDVRIHDNISAVTRRLEICGHVTQHLVETKAGGLFVDLAQKEEGGGVWRLLTYVEGSTFDTVASVTQVRSVGHLVGQFHRALEQVERQLVRTRVGVHDTESHLERLRRALETHGDHRLFQQVGPLSEEILARAAKLEPLPNLPEQSCHGDLKINNILFEGTEPPGRDRARCLIDLDTVGPMHLAFELGDGWRSWCNQAGEDATEGSFDIDMFQASLLGYLEGRGRRLTEQEARALLLGPEWVTLELAARFAADALLESYFGWNRERYPGAGEHNHVRAQGQLSLHRAVMQTRSERSAILTATP